MCWRPPLGGASGCCERGIGGENGLQYPQDSIDAVDIVTPAINNYSVMFKLQKLPVFSCGHTAKDRFQAIAFMLVKQPRSDHLGNALSQAGFNVILLGFDDDDNGGLQHRQRRCQGQDKITFPTQPATEVTIEALSGVNGKAGVRQVSTGQ